jgi:hypothetical protein
MPNQLSLRITSHSVRRVMAEVLEISGSTAGHQCMLTGIWTLPEEWPYSVPAALIAWAIKLRGNCAEEPMVRLRGNVYEAPCSVALCVHPEVLRSEIRDFLSEAEVLEAEYDEPFMDRVVQPLQLIYNLSHSALETDADPDRIEDSIQQITASIRTYAPEFVPPA